jgi:formate dehydrogenase
VNAQRKHARKFPRGRQLDQTALRDVREMLGPGPHQRDLLIEYLHAIQDKLGYLPRPHLAALATEMKLPMAEVYEVASFYAHFDIVETTAAPPPKTTIRVCDSLSCMLAGAEALMTSLQASAAADVRIVRAPCMGACDQAPAAAHGHHLVGQASADELLAIDTGAQPPNVTTAAAIALSDYQADGGYQLLKSCLDGDHSADAIIETLAQSALRGLGGAGFPTHRKWAMVRAQNGRKVVAVNGDEGEPGTFKDRYFLNRDPHRMLEGMLIAAWVVGAADCYLYMRDEYPEIIALLRTEIAALEAAGLARHTTIHLRRGAGAYICGEESAMIESIEGKRGLPRHRPPYVAEVGIHGRPTLVNNIETLFWIRDIVEKGADWFNAQGKPAHPGPRTYSVSGRVKNPGVIIAPAGSTADELIAHAGGMADGHTFKAYLPGGASGGILPASMGDIPLDFGTLEQHGAFVGSHAVVILSDQDSLRDAARNLMAFFKDESCGQCTPCRSGTEKALTLMQAPDWDDAALTALSSIMREASICGLGQAASNPLQSVLRFFNDEK